MAYAAAAPFRRLCGAARRYRNGRRRTAPDWRCDDASQLTWSPLRRAAAAFGLDFPLLWPASTKSGHTSSGASPRISRRAFHCVGCGDDRGCASKRKTLANSLRDTAGQGEAGVAQPVRGSKRWTRGCLRQVASASRKLVSDACVSRGHGPWPKAWRSNGHDSHWPRFPGSTQRLCGVGRNRLPGPWGFALFRPIRLCYREALLGPAAPGGRSPMRAWRNW